MKRWLSLLAILTFAIPAFGQLTPAEALKKFQVADGLQIELFAAEPMLINPTSIDVDEKGRVWVCEAVNYRCNLRRIPFYRPEGDRIVVLVDKDGDGKADESVVFYQGKEIIAPLGICVAPIPPSPQRKQGGYKVFVCQSPDILVFEDLDGDLKADGPPKKFLSGFRGIDHDHGVHGINIGPDGKFYFTVGDAGVQNLQAADGKGPKFTSNSTDCRAGTVWRCDMDGKNLELIAHNFRNNYECCVNSFGEIWLSDNDDDGNQQTRICHVMAGGNYGYHPRGPGQSHWHEEQPGVVHKVARTFQGSPTGICFYEGSLLPKKYHGQLLHTDAGPNEFRAFHLKPKGAGYEAEKEVLVKSSDNWCRFSDVCVAPDGSIILADWYDPGVGGHGMGDWTRGRIYRVTPKGHKGYKVPDVKLDTAYNILSALRSPALATRSVAISHLRARGSDVTKGILDQGIEAQPDPVLKARSIAILPLILSDRSWMNLFKDATREKEYESIRVASVRLLDTYSSKLSDEEWRVEQTKFGKEAPGFVQSEIFTESIGREALLLIRKFDVINAIKPAIYAFAKQYDGRDHVYRAALNIACGTDPARRDAILADFEKHFPEWNDKVADLVFELRPKSMLPKMEKLLADAKLTGPQKARIIDILSSSDDASAGKAMLNLLAGDYPPEVKARAIDNLKLFLPGKWSSLAKSNELKKAIDSLLQDAKTKTSGLQLVAAANYTEAINTIDKTFGLDSPNVQIEAIRTLGKLNDPKAVDVLISIVALLREQTSIRTEAIQALGVQASSRGDSPAARKALEALKEIVTADKWPIEPKVAAVSALAGSRSGTVWLLQLQEQNTLPKELLADAGKMLRNSPYQDLRNKALIAFPPPGKLDPKKLPALSVLAKRAGNADNGKKLMAESLKGVTQCLKCHTVRGVGGNIGPDLSMIGKKAAGKENLLESILLPSKAIADQYVQWKIETANGQSILGLIMEDGPAGVTIRDANGKDTKIARDDIEKRTKSLVSIMPEDIVKGFSEDELIDVVEYLLQLKTASLTPDSWNIVGPFDNDEADRGLDTAYEPEKAKTIDLAATYKGKNGNVKWRTLKHDGTGYFNLAGLYGVGSTTNTASYVYQTITSPVDQDATVLLGNDDGVKIWVNGELLFTNRDHFAATPEKHKIPVRLKKGPNTVLMKIVNGNDPHGFYLSVTSEQELKTTTTR